MLFFCEYFCDAGGDTDVDFDPTADMLVHDCDDERTMDEEEAMSNEESVANELDDLQKVRISCFLIQYQPLRKPIILLLICTLYAQISVT